MVAKRPRSVHLTRAQKQELSLPEQKAELARLREEAEATHRENLAWVTVERSEKLNAAREARALEVKEIKARRLAREAERKMKDPLHKRRQKGARGINLDVRCMILAALERVGGVAYLAKQAERNPVAFMGLIGKVLPMQVTGANGGPIEGQIEHVIVFQGYDRPAHVIEH